MKLTKAMAEKIFSAKTYEEAKKQAAEVGYEMSEQEDAELKKYFTHELSDDELDQVAGGRDATSKRLKTYMDRYGHECTVYQDYVWNGDNEDLKYLCPICNGPVHKGTFGLFYCDPCDEWWFQEFKLHENLANWTKDGEEYTHTSLF